MIVYLSCAFILILIIWYNFSLKDINFTKKIIISNDNFNQEFVTFKINKNILQVAKDVLIQDDDWYLENLIKYE